MLPPSAAPGGSELSPSLSPTGLSNSVALVGNQQVPGVDGGGPKPPEHSRGRSRRSTPSRPSEQHHNKPPFTPNWVAVEGCGMKLHDAAILQLLISCPWVTKCSLLGLPEFCCQLLRRPFRVSHPKCSYPATFLQGIQLQENMSSVCRHR